MTLGRGGAPFARSCYAKMSFKDPTFQERAALAAQAKQKALEKLKAKPQIDPAVAAERLAAKEAREAAEIEKRRAKREAEETAKAEKKAAAIAAEEAKKAAMKPELTEAEKKAIRDAKYAARKKRK